MAFRFKQFTVDDDRSTMRVGTDALLLGAWVDPGNAENILEIGTGCGVISLMIAQKTETHITAIDIHRESVNQAAENFINSRWSERLTALQISFADFREHTQEKFDLIITNPPFFRTSLLPPDARRLISKHDGSLTLEEIAEGASGMLRPEGKLVLILPPAESILFEEIGKKQGLSAGRKLKVFSKQGQKPVRIVLEMQKNTGRNPSIGELILRNQDGTFSADYLKLTSEYHCFTAI